MEGGEVRNNNSSLICVPLLIRASSHKFHCLRIPPLWYFVCIWISDYLWVVCALILLQPFKNTGRKDGIRSGMGIFHWIESHQNKYVYKCSTPFIYIMSLSRCLEALAEGQSFLLKWQGPKNKYFLFFFSRVSRNFNCSALWWVNIFESCSMRLLCFPLILPRKLSTQIQVLQSLEPLF